MAWPWPLVVAILPIATVAELVSLTLLLSTIEYTIIGLIIGKAVHGKKLRQFAVARGWEWHKGDPQGSLRAAAPAALGKVRRRRIKHTIRGEMPQGPFTLWVHKNPWRWHNGRTTILVETRMPHASPGFVIQARDADTERSSGDPSPLERRAEQMLTPALADVVRAHPDATWDWTGDRLIVSSTSVKGMDALQELVCAADKFRALAPEAHTPPAGSASHTTEVVALTA